MDPRPCAISLSGVEAVCLLQVLAHPAPRRDARATPYGFSRMQRVTVVDDADALCLHAQRTCLRNWQDIDASACVEAVREIYDIAQRNSQEFSRRLIGWLLSRWFQISFSFLLYTQLLKYSLSNICTQVKLHPSATT